MRTSRWSASSDKRHEGWVAAALCTLFAAFASGAFSISVFAAAITPDPVRTWTAPPDTTYYVDALHGSDSSNGLSAKTPWRTFTKVNSGAFAPGDKILLCLGRRWTGYLDPGGSGTPHEPIFLSRYGPGPRPSLDAQGKFLATVFLQNCDCWQVNDLDIANRGTAPQPGLMGVSVNEYNFGTAYDIVLDKLSVHNVTGSDDKAAGGGSGINCSCGGSKVRSRFDGLWIENCYLDHTDRNGITLGGNWQRNNAWFPSVRVVIRGNRLIDIGGDGIVPIGCDGAIVAHNVLKGGRMRAKDYAAGIWPWGCDNTLIEYNDVSGMKGTHDGEGYDSDYDCRNSLFQYNISHNNDGGFMLICDDGSQTLPWNIGNSGTVIRDNLSIDDGDHTFNITGPCHDTKIYNNTFYIGKGQSVTLVNGGNWGGSWPSDTVFENNIFDAAGSADFHFGGMTDTLFDHNCFWGNITGRPADPHTLLTNPNLAAPGGLNPADYRPLPAIPALGAFQSPL